MSRFHLIQSRTLTSVCTLLFLGTGSFGLSAAEPGLALEEVTVTAQRREQSLQEVPLSVSSFAGTDLERGGITDIIAVGRMAPNVTLEVSRGSNTTLTAFIRGIGQQDPVAGFEAGVGLYLDDVYLNRPQGSVLEVYDVERIEVLRGPQGTLYGRNTIGGAIKYVTRRLGDEPELRLKGAFGNYGQIDGTVTGSVPLADTFRVGGSLASFNNSGYGDNINISGLDNYERSIMAGRVSAEWTPTDSLFFRFAADYMDDDSDPRQGHRLIPSTAGDPVLSDVFDTRSGLNNPQQEVEAWGLALNGEWTLNDTWTVKNILAYRKDKSDSPIDFDSLPAADLDVPVRYKNKQFSEELQVHYASERLNGMLGFYYLDANAFNAFDVILDTTGQLIALPGLNAFTLGDVDTETWSVFGDFTYDVTDNIYIALGGRYTSDKRSSTVLRQLMIGGTSSLFGGTAVPIATTSDFSGKATFKEFTPRATIGWSPLEDHNLYFTYSRGFKGGGFDPRGQTSAAPDLDGDGNIDSADIFAFMSFDSEIVDSYEIGYKASLLNNRVEIALAAFITDYKGVQIPGSVGIDTDNDGINDTFTGVTSNAASADLWGIEFEGRAILANDMARSGDDLNLVWSVGYINPEFKEFIDAFGIDVANQRAFQNTPDWTASASLTYATPFAIGGNSGRLSLINAISYRSEASQFETPNPFLDQKAFALWDASLVWEDDEGHWQIGLHGKNLTDKEYIVAGYNFVAPGTNAPTLGQLGTLTGFYGNPRTVTGTISYRY